MNQPPRSKRAMAKAVRELDAALGMTNRRQMATCAILALAIGAALFAGAWFVVAPRGPTETTSGVIQGLGFVEREEGSKPFATVLVDNRVARVALWQGQVCRIGDRIDLTRRKGFVGYRYAIGRGGCRPAPVNGPRAHS